MAQRNNGFGCQRCGSTDLKQSRSTTAAGWIVFLIGLGGACFTYGLTLILCIFAAFMNVTMAKCRECGWKWQP